MQNESRNSLDAQTNVHRRDIVVSQNENLLKFQRFNRFYRHLDIGDIYVLLRHLREEIAVHPDLRRSKSLQGLLSVTDFCISNFPEKLPDLKGRTFPW